MRNAINENRMVQLALVGIVALAGGLMLLKTTKGSGSETSAAPSAESTEATAPAPAATPAPTTSAPATPTSGAAATPATPAAGVSVPASMVPGPGLPKGLRADWNHGKAIALLVRRAGGIDDRLVRSSVEGLNAYPRVEVYVTKARGIARYAWLTQGVNVTELPALVVLEARDRKGPPSASVSYGFRNGASVVQAVKDALYAGPSDRPYHP